MTKTTSDSNPVPLGRSDSSQPLPPQAADFTRRLHGMLDGQPKDEATVTQAFEGLEGMFDLIAAGLYTFASMLVGEGEESIALVETAVANAEISACANADAARLSSRRALARAALELLARRDPASLAAPEGLEHAVTCIEEDDLSAAGVSREELDRMMAGPDRDRVRVWIEGLPTATRAIFALRAVAGFPANETAALLVAHGGPQASSWNTEAVRELFRQGLCSLTSQMIHASNAR